MVFLNVYTLVFLTLFLSILLKLVGIQCGQASDNYFCPLISFHLSLLIHSSREVNLLCLVVVNFYPRALFTFSAESRSIGGARRKLGSPKQRHGEENVQVQTLAMLKYMCYKVNIGGYLIVVNLTCLYGDQGLSKGHSSSGFIRIVYPLSALSALEGLSKICPLLF